MVSLSPEKQGTFIRASISNVCNFSCQYCATDLGMENHTPKCLQAPLLTGEEYIRNMKLLAQHGFKIISFTGGEPLLNPESPQIVEGCRPLFETIEITTNGTKLLENIEVVKEYIDVLKISIDACDEELASRIAGNAKGKYTKSVIEACCKEGIKTIGLNFVYMRQNERELSGLADFAHDMKECRAAAAHRAWIRQGGCRTLSEDYSGFLYAGLAYDHRTLRRGKVMPLFLKT